MNGLSARAHGAFDYLFVAALALAPLLLPLGPTAALICYTVAVAHLLVSLITDYDMGAARVIPFAVHGGIEAAISAFLIASPWLFGFDESFASRAFFVSAGLGLGAVWLLTRYRVEPRRED